MGGDGNDRLVAVRGARLVDVEAGTVLEGNGLLVRGERIEGLLDPGSRRPRGLRSSTWPGTRCSRG